MNTIGLAIFVKTPSLSAVKTRLWPSIGRRRAEAFHLASAEAVASVVRDAQTQSPLRAHWAVAERDAMHDDMWSDLPQLYQGEGGLGERMRHVHGQLLRCHAGAALIGADAPQLATASLMHAVNWLQADVPRLVIGPARDGGFWLFGSNRAMPEQAWTAVEYSAPNTARDFLARMGSQGECLVLEMLNDVDHYADFSRARDELKALASPTDAQQRLRAWMREVTEREGVCS